MALIKLKFFKVTGLPSEPEANAVYYVIGDDFAEWYVTDADGAASPSGNSAMITALIAAANLAQLDEKGKLDPAVIPVFKSHEFVVVANQAARLLLTEEDIQIGDEAFELDSGKTYTLVAADPAQGASWRFKSDTTPEWSAIANKPATFAPSAHNHAIAEVTGLQAALDEKVSNTENFSLGTLPSTQVKIDGDNSRVLIGDADDMGSGTKITIDDSAKEIDILAISGVLINGLNIESTISGKLDKNSTNFIGFTSTAAFPTTAEYPTDKDWGFHKNTSAGKLYFTFNEAGTVRYMQFNLP